MDERAALALTGLLVVLTSTLTACSSDDAGADPSPSGAWSSASDAAGGSYTPGGRRSGSTTDLTVEDWRGQRLTERYVLVFDDGSRSGRVASATTELRRGEYRIEATWTTSDVRQVARLDALTRSLVSELDEAAHP